MQLYIDLNAAQAVTGFGSTSPLSSPIVLKNQDTVNFAVYFLSQGVVQDLGASLSLEFGLVQQGSALILVFSSAFTRQVDAAGNAYYAGKPIFYTTQMQTALGSNTSISCLGEFRYQLTTGEIEHCLDIPFTVFRTIIQETTVDTTTAAFTTPAIGSNVNVQINNTNWLVPNEILSIGAGAGLYQVISITNATTFVAQNTGAAGNASSGTNIPSGTSVGTQPPAVPNTYPAVASIELKANRDVASGYPSLDVNTLLKASEVPVDGATINVSAGNKIQSAFVLTTTTANYTQPAINSTVSVTVGSTTGMVAGQFLRVLIGGFYSISSVTDGTHVVLTNIGDPFNASASTNILSGSAILPAQAASGGGSPGTNGVNAYTTTSSSFTTPAINATVTIQVANTAWMGGLGQVLFIAGAGYYSINAVVDSTHVTITNLGGSNTASGTVITSGAAVSPGGPQGQASAIGQSAYDTITASFVMPAANATVSVTMHSTAWFSANQILYVGTAGYFQVSSITNSTTAVLTNLNYSGNASVSTNIAAGSTISPGGLQGATGSATAFTTTTALFTQPAVNSTVTITVGATAWMAQGETIFISTGGYYTVTTINSGTSVTITNPGYPGNAAPTTSVPGSSAVSVAGPSGTNGRDSFTTTTANFSQPASGLTVTATVASTAWMAQGQNIFISGGGYYSIAAITDSTHVILSNLGSSGNVTSGTVVNSGANVSPAGATGAGGSGTGGGSTSQTTSAIWDPQSGLYWYDPFVWITIPNNLTGLSSGSGGLLWSSTYGQDNVKKVIGCAELSTGITNSLNEGQALYYGASGTGNGSIIYGLGSATFKTSIFWEAQIPGTGVGYRFRWGLGQQQGSGYVAASPAQAIFFEWVPDNNSGAWRVGVGGASITYTNCSPIPTFDTRYDLELDINASWTTATFIINGSTIATVTSGIPLTKGNLFWLSARDTGTTNFLLAADHGLIAYSYVT